MIQEIAIVSISILLSIAAWQDVKTREVDARLFIAMSPPAVVLIWLNWHNPLYIFSLAVGLGIAILMRILCAGYADSLAMIAIATAPPLYFMPSAFVTITAGSALLPITMAWLYVKNRGRPCVMSVLERLTHICVSREEFYSSVKYVHKSLPLCLPFRKNPIDLERYNPRDIKIEEEWVKAAYGMPYLVVLTVGFMAYTIVTLTL